jgi:predicted phage tail protein
VVVVLVADESGGVVVLVEGLALVEGAAVLGAAGFDWSVVACGAGVLLCGVAAVLPPILFPLPVELASEFV